MANSQLKQARIALGLSQAEFAKALGWTTAKQIVNIENGHREMTAQTQLAVECLLRRAKKWPLQNHD
jgi:transcriptional regulator with XRE-family HTH domain